MAQRQGNLPLAAAPYQQVLALAPDHGETRSAIAELNIADDQKRSALAQLRQISAPAPGSVNLEQRTQVVEFELLRRQGCQPI